MREKQRLSIPSLAEDFVIHFYQGSRLPLKEKIAIRNKIIGLYFKIKVIEWTDTTITYSGDDNELAQAAQDWWMALRRAVTEAPGSLEEEVSAARNFMSRNPRPRKNKK